MLSTEEVRRIARLARIGLEEKEIETFQTDLSAVLGSFQELEGADVDGMSVFDPMPSMTNALRDDVPKVPDIDEQMRILSNFPRKEGRNLTVKSVF